MSDYLKLLYLLKRRREQAEEEQEAESETKRKDRRWSVRPINSNRATDGEYRRLVVPMRVIDPQNYLNYFRMTRDTFDLLLAKVKPHITHAPTHNTPIHARERLALTLRLLASGDSFTSLAYSYRMGLATVAAIFSETTEAIWNVLKGDYLKEPNEAEWKEIQQKFEEKWDFPNCVGAVDGKHCLVKAPPKSGSLFFNYKQSFSIVLMAVVDADYGFIMVNVGNYGSAGDSTIFKESEFGMRLENQTLNLPPPRQLPGTDTVIPSVLIGDEAFPLKTFLMKPYPRSDREDAKVIFNYRLSRARRVVENAFGILAQRWRVLMKPMETHPETADKTIRSCVAMHNFLKKVEPNPYLIREKHGPSGTERENNEIGSGMVPLGPHRSNNPRTQVATEVRDRLKEYFVSEPGRLSWQSNVLSVGTAKK